ncbi:MAG TPA: 6-carboxytetrahydropterin synthase, partial [Flavobacteriaceae bacterium]
MIVTVSRKAHFNAAHRLYRKEWSDEKNAQVFGKCSNPNFHGHNYELIVSVTGKINKQTGFVMDMKVLKDIIREEVEDAFDHKNLNIEVEEFKNLNPTAENIVIIIYNKIRARLDSLL